MAHTKEKSKRNRILVWISGILITLLLLLGGAAWYLSTSWKPIIDKKLKTLVSEESRGLYRIEYDDIHLNLLTGNASLDNVRLIPDKSVIERLKKADMMPSTVLEISADALIISRVAVWRAYTKQEISLKSIVFDKPVLRINKYKKGKSEEPRSLYEQISATLRSVAIRNILLTDASMVYADYSEEEADSTKLKHITLKLTDVLVDSASQNDESRLYFSKDIFFQIKDHQAVSNDGMYTIKFDELSGSSQSGFIKLSGLKMIPKYGEMEFSRKYSRQHDRYDLAFGSFTFNGVNFRELDTKQRILATKLDIEDVKAAIFLNRELPLAPIDKKVNFPHIALRRLGIQLHIDTVNISRANVRYTEFSPESKKSGTITISGMQGTILNVTNDSASLNKKSHAFARFSARLMGSIPINLDIDFNLTDPAGAFSYSGNIGRFNMTVLNPVAMPLGLLEVKSGVVNKATFSMRGNTSGVNGNLNLYYNNLKVELFEKDQESKQIDKKGLLSVLANALVVKNDNPAKGEALRPGTSSFSRPPSSSFFNLLWKGIFVGLREAVGLGDIPMKKPGEVSKKEARKQEREQRKAEREERKKQ